MVQVILGLPSERNAPRNLNIPRGSDAPVIPHAKVRTRYISVEGAAARSAREQESSYVVEVMLIENVKRISAQLESKTLGDLNRFFQTDVKVAIPRLPEGLNTWSFAVVKVKAASWFKRVHIQNRLAWVEMGWRLQKRGRTRQQSR